MTVQEIHHIHEKYCVSGLVIVCTLVNFALKKAWCSNILCGRLKIAPARPDRKAGLDSGLDSGLDFGLDSGLDFGLTFIDLK